MLPSPSHAAAGSEQPLLLAEDETRPQNASTGPTADNSRCQVCHLNLVQEELVVIHAKASVGCAGCHGQSDAHIADESWASGGNGTAPDIMYPRPKINPFCVTCHPKENLDNTTHHEFLAGISEAKTCTDCHGKHRLPARKCKWK